MENKLTVANFIIILLLISIAIKLGISFSWVWRIIGGVICIGLIVLLIYLIPRNKLFKILEKISLIPWWDIFNGLFGIAIFIIIVNAIFFDKPKEEPKEMTTYTSKLDGMTDEERDDYLGSLGFSTERSREKFNNDTKNRYALIVDEMGNFKYIDKCEDSNFYDKVDRSLCNKGTIDKIDNNNTYYSRTYGSDISYKLTSSYNEECQEPENPYWDGGHSAGFDRAEETGGYCDGNSESFNEGCEEYYRQLEEYEACEYNQ